VSNTSSTTSDDLIDKYKRQTYLIAFPLGICISLFYAFDLGEKSGLRFDIAIGIVVELSIFIILLIFAKRFMLIVEPFFYFSTMLFFVILTQTEIRELATAGLLDANKLANALYSLVMWMFVFLLGAFLALNSTHVKVLIIFMLTSVAAMAVYDLVFGAPAGSMEFSYVFKWSNALTALFIASILIQRMGLLQHQQASTDALTGILNRHALYHILGQEMERAGRYKRPFSIILFDLDQFKTINDTFGHLEGDKVLKEISQLVGSLVRRTDFLGRWGGEEFLLILPETDSEAAQALAERIRKSVEITRIVEDYSIAASFGVTTYHIERSLEDLLDFADRALYQAKHNGRNQVVVKVA
jgi:diguanylate cyclase (GGDEF)-like protein